MIAVARRALADSGIDSTDVRFAIPTVNGGLAGEVRMAAELSRRPGVVAVVGHQSSRPTLLAAPIYGDAGIPLVVPTATSRRLRDAGAHVFAMAPDDSVEGAFIVAFARERLGAAALTIAYTPDEFGLGVRAGVEVAAAARAMRIIDALPVSESACRDDQADPYALAARASLRRGVPQVVVVATSTTIAACVVRAFRAEQRTLRFIMADGAAASDEFQRIAGPAGDSAWFVAFWHQDVDSTRSQSFRSRFRELTGRDPSASEVVWYDALVLAALAARDSRGRPSRARDALAAIGGDRPAYPGLAGPIGFAPRRPLPLVMTQLVSGATRLVSR